MTQEDVTSALLAVTRAKNQITAINALIDTLTCMVVASVNNATAIARIVDQEAALAALSDITLIKILVFVKDAKMRSRTATLVIVKIDAQNVTIPTLLTTLLALVNNAEMLVRLVYQMLHAPSVKIPIVKSVTPKVADPALLHSELIPMEAVQGVELGALTVAQMLTTVMSAKEDTLISKEMVNANSAILTV